MNRKASKTSCSKDIPDEMLQAYRILKDPVLWGEKFLCNQDGSPRTYWKHQVEDLRNSRAQIIHQDGREVGKTIVLTTLVLHFGFTTPNDSGLVVTPNQGHLETIIEEAEHQIFSNPDLEASIAKNRLGHLDIKRKPYYQIRFAGGTLIHFRPAGDKGQSLRSLHVNRIWVDEGAWLTERAWKALRRCLNANGHLRIYSNPNGLRDSTYYRLTQDKSKRWFVVRWPSMLHPNWTKEREEELVEFYGGRDTSGYQHEILGEHGSPSYAAFNVEAFHTNQKMNHAYRKVVITGEEMLDCSGDEDVRTRLDLLLGLTPQPGEHVLGGDLGYTSDPCELVVFERDEEACLSMVLRVHLEHVAYPYIAEAVAALDTYFEFTWIGIDKGGNGLAVEQDLKRLDKFADHNFGDRLEAFDFGSSTVIGFNTSGKQIKKRTKELMTSLINGRLARKLITFPDSDIEVEDQFTTQTYTMSNGKIIYSKGRDHIIDAVRCAVLAVELEEMREIDTNVEEIAIMPMTTKPIFRF